MYFKDKMDKGQGLTETLFFDKIWRFSILTTLEKGENTVLVMTKHDLEMTNILRSEGILEKVREDYLDYVDGAIIFGCPDCDQFDDMIRQHEKYCLAHRTEPRIHPLTEHGGASILSPHTALTVPSAEMMNFARANLPASMCQTDTALLHDMLHHLRPIFSLWDLYRGLGMKNIRSIGLYDHAPCGAAYEIGMQIERLLMDQVAGHWRVQKLFPEIQVVSFCHICYPDRAEEDNRKTYRLHTGKLAKFFTRHTIDAEPLLPPIL